MSNNVQRIKEKLGIVEVVSAYLKLEKAGANLKGKCPFHNEKTPSFFVSPERGTYKCFGCGAGGDIFTFVENFEGVDFSGALKILAEKAGVELIKEDPKVKDERDLIFRIMEEATLFFEKNLTEKSSAKDYLTKRGLTQETITKFRIGFARDEWSSLYDFLKEKKYNDSDIEKAGLVKKREKGSGFYDRLRSRIIFPIFDSSGRVVAFSGRIFESDSDKEQAKYLNSPETVLFHKSKILFGYNFAKNDIRKRDFSILVEGQMDIIMLHQTGFTNTVATSGTALTEDHLLLLKRLSNKIAMAFDGDEAGLKAANKGALLALKDDMEVKLIEIPKDFDPADFVLKDKDGWVNALKNSVHIIDFNLNILLNKSLDKRQMAIEARKTVLPLVANINSSIEQDYFVSKISDKLGFSKDAIWQDLSEIEKGDEQKKPSEEPNNKTKSISFKNKAIREILGIYFWQKDKKDNDLEIEKILEKINSLVDGEMQAKIFNISEEIKNELIFEAENLYIDEEGLQNKLNELFVNLEKEDLKEKRKEVWKKIQEGDDSNETLEIYHDLSKKIENI